LCGLKLTEFRSWTTGFRGRILLHASKTFAPEALDLYPSLEGIEVYVGALVGVVDVVDIRPDPDWPETFAWQLANPPGS
jgi:hypothetical protein